MKLLTATLTEQPRQVTTKYGPRIVADCTLDNGEKVTLWQPGTSQLINYGYGYRLTLTIDSKGKYHWVENANEPNDKAIAANSEPTNANELSNNKKREIAEYITQQTKLFGFCYEQTKLIDGLSQEDRRAVATTLFVQAQKKFNL